MEKRRKKKQILQWHPAFYAGIQIELEEESDKLIFENEHQIGTKPKEIDVLIIKKDFKTKINKNIGRIFRKYNIIEYKSPDDYLSIDSFYKVYGYACFYKSDVTKPDKIPAEDITITFVCHHYPKRMMVHLEKKHNMSIAEQEDGIYYLSGNIFPMQVIVVPQLSEKDNFWLRSMTNHLKEYKTVEKLLFEYRKHEKEGLYTSVMEIIVRANMEIFEEVNNMCDALKEIMKDELDARQELGLEQGLERGLEHGLECGLRALVTSLKPFLPDFPSLYQAVVSNKEYAEVTEADVRKYF